MKRRLSSLLAIAVVTVIGVFLYQYTVFNGIRAQLEEQSEAVASAYITLIEEDIPGMRATYPFTTAQERQADRIQETVASLSDDNMSVETRVQTIGALQASLHKLSDSLGGNEDISRDPHFAHLQRAIGENGDVRDLLETYNTTAVRWNNNVQGEIGSLLGRIDGSARNILPYLRFDGGTEFVPVISL